MGRARRLGEAFEIVEELAATSGIRPNIHVYTCLVQACAQNRKIDRALKLHDTMIVEKGAAVVRCANHLPGHKMALSKGAPQGVEQKVIEELLAKLGAGSATDKTTAAALASELKAAGIDSRRAGNGSPPSGARRGRA